MKANWGQVIFIVLLFVMVMGTLLWLAELI